MIAVLDPSNAEQAGLLQRLAGVDPGEVAEAALDDAAYQSQRLLMHDLVLTTLRGAGRDRVADRFRQGEKLRVFSVGIGGLDLGMDQVLARAQGGRMTLTGGGFGSATTLHGSLAAASASGDRPAMAAAREPRAARVEGRSRVLPTDRDACRTASAVSARIPETVVRSHGNRFETGPPVGRKNRPAWTLAVYGEDGPEVRSRRLDLDPRGGVSAYRAPGAHAAAALPHGRGTVSG